MADNFRSLLTDTVLEADHIVSHMDSVVCMIRALEVTAEAMTEKAYIEGDVDEHGESFELDPIKESLTLIGMSRTLMINALQGLDLAQVGEAIGAGEEGRPLSKYLVMEDDGP